MTIKIARMCHAAHREWCALHGDTEHKSWEEAEQRQRDLTIWGIKLLLEHPEVTDEEHHDIWWKMMYERGWRYGELRDPVAKTHPGMRPYREMDPWQQKKKPLFRAIVMALIDQPPALRTDVASAEGVELR